MNFKNQVLLGSLLAIGLVACGDDSETGAGGSGTTSTSSTTSSTTTSSTTASGDQGGGGSGDGGSGAGGGDGGAGGGGGLPAVPELGAQLERMGRPGINTATVDTFIRVVDADPPIALATNEERSAAEDAYNAAVNGSADAAAFVTTQAAQLTVLDSLDGTCGNQPLYGFGADPAANCLDDGGNPDLVEGAPLACYGTLAAVLNYDTLWLKTTYESCQIYLGVEADLAGTVAPNGPLPANADCGGRRPIDDVIQTTYSVVAGAVTAGPTFGFDDGVTAPPDLHPEAFPFLAAPHE